MTLILSNPDFGCLFGQPLAVVHGEGVVADEARSRREIFGWPVAKFACCGGDGQSEFGAHVAQVGVVGGCLRVGDLAVDFPGCVPFEAAHDFPFALAFGGAFSHVVLGSLARSHSDKDYRMQGVLALRSPPLLSRWRVVLPEDAGMGATPTSEANCASFPRRSGLSPTVTSS